MSKVKLRDYQNQCIQVIEDSFENSNRQLVQIPTGGGKTFIFLAYLERNSQRSLTIIPSRELMEQIEENSKHFLEEKSVYARKNSIWKKANHYIVTAQSLNYESTTDYLFDTEFDTIIVDEAHRSQAPTYKNFLEKYMQVNPGVKILGMTATPERNDKKPLLELFDKITFNKTIHGMILEGHLCDVESFRIKTGQKFNTRKLQGGDFSPIALRDLDNDTRNNLIIKVFKENCIHKKTIIFCVSVNQAKKLAETFKSEGICCEAIYGDMSYKERQLILQRFKSGITQVVTNCQLLTEGFDEPSIEAMIIARPTKSKTLYCQMIGRGLRKFPGKKVCSLYELTDNVHNICTFTTAADPHFQFEFEYKNGQKLTELRKNLDKISILDMETVIEKITLFSNNNQYLNNIEALSTQIDEIKKRKIPFFSPITAYEAGFLIWKDKLKEKFYGNN